MSVWVLHLPLTREEEDAIAARTTLPLPLSDLPDLSLISNATMLRHLLQTLAPDAPPEVIGYDSGRIWRWISEIGKEDLIAVPLPARKEVAIAEVNGPYAYEVNAAREDGHLLPVRWHAPRIAFLRLGKWRDVFLQPGRDRLVEVTAPEARALVRERLPHKYNRFARWKWIIAIVIAIKLSMFALYTFFGRGPGW